MIRQLAWKKESDTAAYHPIVLAPMAFVDWPERLTEQDFANIVWGFISRAATQSASYKTDYVVTAGTLVSLAGSNWRHWVAIAIRAGYLSPVQLDDGSEAWLLVEDSEDLFHIRRKAEIEWERQRRKDTNLPSLIIPVRLRDGDGCRYCGVVVVWGVQQGGRGGTYDHRVPGQAAQSPDDLRVSCRQCNGVRSDRPDADEILPPRSAPTHPFYGEQTVALLAKHGHTVPRSNAKRAKTPAQQPATSEPAAGRTPQLQTSTTGAQAPRATPQPAGSRSTTQRSDAQPDTAPSNPATRLPAGPRSTPRDPASGGTTHAPTTQQPAQPQPRAAPTGTDRSAVTSTDSPSVESRRNQPIGGLRGPGSPGRERVGSGSGREPPPVPATSSKRSRGRRGRSSRPRSSPPAQPPPQPPAQQEEQAW